MPLKIFRWIPIIAFGFMIIALVNTNHDITFEKNKKQSKYLSTSKQIPN